MGGIFVSYDSRDRSRVDPLVQELRRITTDIFWDKDTIPVGKEWRYVIDSNLRKSKAVVVVASVAFVVSVALMSL